MFKFLSSDFGTLAQLERMRAEADSEYQETAAQIQSRLEEARKYGIGIYFQKVGAYLRTALSEADDKEDGK